MSIRTWTQRADWAAFTAAGLAAAAGPVAAKVTTCEIDAKNSPREMLPACITWDDATREAVFTDRVYAGGFQGAVVLIVRDGGRDRINLRFDVPEATFKFSSIELLVAGPLSGENEWHVGGASFKGKGAQRVLDGFLQDSVARATCLSHSALGSSGRP